MIYDIIIHIINCNYIMQEGDSSEKVHSQSFVIRR